MMSQQYLFEGHFVKCKLLSLLRPQVMPLNNKWSLDGLFSNLVITILMTSFIFEMNAGVRAIRESWIFVRTAKVLAWYEQLYAVGQNCATSDCVRVLTKYPKYFFKTPNFWLEKVSFSMDVSESRIAMDQNGWNGSQWIKSYEMDENGPKWMRIFELHDWCIVNALLIG